MYEELVKRLRECEKYCDSVNFKDNTFKKAADAIEELQKELLDKRNEANNYAYDVGYWSGRRDYEPKWISVEERLPEAGIKVLTFDNFGAVSIGWYNSYANSGRWYTGFMRKEWTVTHWMPLPEPPKEET